MTTRLDQLERLEKAATAGPWGLCTKDCDGVTFLATLHTDDAHLIAAARSLAPAFLSLARAVDDCVTKLGYLEPANLTDTERHVMHRLRTALAPLLEEAPDV